MTMQNHKAWLFTLTAGFTSIFMYMPTIAYAHHPMGGAMPSSFMQGLLSGIGHPIIGLDHLAFIVAAGVLAWKMGKPLRLLGCFIAATVTGSLVISSGLSIALTEPLVLLSVALLGLALLRNKMPNQTVITLFYAAAGFFHGCAYGAAVIGAEATPIVAYLIGFAVIQFAIAVAAAQTVSLLSKSTEERLTHARMTGALVLGVAVTYGFEIAESALLGMA